MRIIMCLYSQKQNQMCEVLFLYYLILQMHSNHLNSLFFTLKDPLFTHYYFQSLHQFQSQSQLFGNYNLQNKIFYSSNFDSNFPYFQKLNKTYQNKVIVQSQEQQKIKSQIKESQVNKDQKKFVKTQGTVCRQKYGRNITSNIFRSLIRRICGQNNFKILIEKAINIYCLQTTYQIFVSQIDIKCKNLSSYVRKSEMKSFWTPKNKDIKELQFCKLFRIVCKKYFKEDHVLNVFYSKKINKQSRQLHFTFSRQMNQLIKQ